MAIKTLLLRKKLNDKRAELEALERASADFEKRESELTAAIEEAQTDEEKTAVEEAVESFDNEKAAHDDKLTNLRKEIEEIETEIEKDEAELEKVVEAPEVEKRKETKEMEIRKNHDFTNNEEMQSFLTEVRSAIREKRAITNAGLIIPQDMMAMLREKVTETSKVVKHVNLQRVSGTSRQTIMGTVPEAVWTEMCANLNELTLAFNDVELDGYKVGGYFAVCNAIVEDNDVDLVNKLVEALGRAIGFALDKAILYGTGVKMPLGVVTRLAQTSEPSGYPTTARTWVDLHTSNIITGTGATGNALVKEIITNAKVVNSDYGTNMVWFMNHKTHMSILAETLGVNANGAIVSGVNGEMPIIGGVIEELSFIPDNNIVFGYFEDYTLAERAGTKISTSEHAMFIQDKTVLKGTARYDGVPAIAEAFGVMSITSTAPTTSVTFASDTANFQ